MASMDMPPDPALLLLQHSAERLGPSAPAPTHQLPSVPPPDGLSILDSASLFQISPSKTPTASGIVTPAENQLSLDSLELEAYKAVTAFAGDAQISKKTQEMYGRHLREYVAFFEQREAEKLKEDPNYVPLPALPITPAKAALFVLNEMQRSKVSVFAVLFFFFNDQLLLQRARDGTDIPTSDTVGRSSIRQSISALEHHRLRHQHLHKDDIEARTSLRSDMRIHDLERATAHRESERLKAAHALKQAGASPGECLFLLLTSFSFLISFPHRLIQ